MRQLFLSISFLCIAAVGLSQPKYDVLWKKVETLSNDRGLTKSALETVNSIYTMAKKEKSQGQMLKALIRRASLENNFDENSDGAINTFRKEIAGAKGAEKAILQSLLAESYLNFYQNRRYELMNRTPVAGSASSDVKTWSMEDFQREISNMYRASLQPEKLLQATQLEDFDPIINKGNARFLRPTLYDLLAHRALDYFEDEEQDVVRPAYSFRVDQPEYLMPAADFLRLNIKSNDTLSVHHQAFQLLQKLMRFHQNDLKADAFVDVDIRRLKLAHEFAVVAKMDDLFVSTLSAIGNNYPKVPAAGRALLELAEYYAEKSNDFLPSEDNGSAPDNDARTGYVKAEKLCEQILDGKAEKFARSGAENLLQQIRLKKLHVETEIVNLPGLPFLSSVSFRNLEKIYLRVIPAADSLLDQSRRKTDAEYWKTLIAIRTLRTWQQALPTTKDHLEHRTEIKIDALPIGSYLILVSGSENFDLGGVLAAQQTAVSALSVVQDNFDYFVVNRQSGKPLEKVKAQILLEQYSAKERRMLLEKGPVLQTDANGHFHFVNQDKNNRNGGMELVSGNDRLTIRNNVRPLYWLNERNPDAEIKGQFFFFTDRAIYRPGQIVQFKALLINRATKDDPAHLITGRKVKIRLFDNNDQAVDSLDAETNEFGSVKGSFKLPTSRLTGFFRIQATGIDGQASFSVEEYKRPRFSVEMQNPAGAYRLGDSIRIKGKALAFAGNNLSNANVKFRVIRNTNFIFRGYAKRFLPQREMEIANGILRTNDTGGFEILFRAIADKETDDSFTYTVTADVTDLNGETQNASSMLTISRVGVNLRLGLNEKESISVQELQKLTIFTTNAGGIYQRSNFRIDFFTLKAPDRLIRSREWERPDLFTLSRDSFLASFPLDEYDRETDPETWLVSSNPYTVNGNTRPDGKVYIENDKLKSGWYRVVAVTHDSYGAEIRDTTHIQVVGNQPSEAPAYVTKIQSAKSTQPGKRFVERFGTSAADVYLFQHYDFNKVLINRQDTSSVNYEVVKLNREVKEFSYLVTEKERGGFGINRFFVKDNRVYSANSTVDVPWTNKELNISYSTFRDKTLPGSKERWNVKISGDQKDIVAAEMLASMYDASLDEFAQNNWNKPDVWPLYFRRRAGLEYHGFGKNDSRDKFEYLPAEAFISPQYDVMLTPSQEGNRRMTTSRLMASAAPMTADFEAVSLPDMNKVSGKRSDRRDGNLLQADTTSFDGSSLAQGNAQAPVKARSNFNETAFFLPDLHTDADGNIEFSFIMPEALTKWKLQLLAHTADLKFGFSTREIITQKDLMVQPNAMRFLREGDRLELSTKIVNLGSKEITGIAKLELFDAVTMAPLDGFYQNVNAKQYFTVAAGASSETSFPVQVPFQYGQAVLYRITAQSTSLPQEIGDGEEAILPVLTNSILVTETMPLPVKTGESKTFSFDRLLKSGSSETLKQQGLTVEFTTNPSWYAVRALPFLAAESFHCSERVFNQFYANALAISIANSSPHMRQVIEKWKSTKSLSSPLQKNEELKSVLLQETPWLLEGLNDSLQQQNISRLFETATNDIAQSATLDQLKQFQLSNGGFSWFEGGRDDRFITQYIISGIGHLQKLGAIKPIMEENLQPLLTAALRYLDKRLEEDYAALLKNKADVKSNHLSYVAIQYLYTRSFFPKQPLAATAKKAHDFYLGQAGKFWVNQTRLAQGMLALAGFRNAQPGVANAILKSLKENAIRNTEQGTYWKDVRPGYFWYQAPVETQSVVIEAFHEIAKDEDFVNELRTWLLKNKQANHWASTKATADACYALLLQGTNWLSAEPVATIRLGNKVIDNSRADAGTGYFKENIKAEAVTPSMGNIHVEVKSNANAETKIGSPVWGAVYWQYFERTEKISAAGNAVQMSKKLFIERHSDRGPVLVAVQDGSEIKLGDKVRVRIELRADRDLEYVQLKDMRASGFEPLNVLSGYKWQSGMGYYEATGDASTNFFFDQLRKGTHVFEYSLYAAQKGNFSNGITSIQCLYAPEFASHSEGIRVNIEQ